jgi:acetylornithine deacetylase/succinyl-diaminopimelate desuccinylase-like protein
MATVRSFIDSERDAFVTDLLDWLSIPSISADPAHLEDVRRCADWLAAALRGTGFPIVEVWETPAGRPAVFAEWPADDESAPTVVVYGHHDVQPVDPLDRWTTAPFEPVVRGARIVGRGSADDKGQVFFHTLGVRAHLAATGRSAPAVTLKLLIEGEEESGSPYLSALLTERRDRLRCDVVVVTDTGMWGPDTPSTCTAMRGLTECQVDLHGPDIDLHSGSFGGAVRNPLTELCRIVAALHDDQARITIPGFYDDVVPLSDEERELFARLPLDEAAWLKTAASREAYGEAGYTTLERIWARPTAEVNGIWGGYTGPGGKTIVPTDAHVKLSFRLVANQDPVAVQRQFDAWLTAHVPTGVTANITWGGATRPCATPLDHPALQSIQRAMSRAFDREVLYTREGGSGPEADLGDILEAPVVFLGVGLPDDQVHAPNEKVELPMLLKGAEAAAYLWEDLAATLPESARST